MKKKSDYSNDKQYIEYLLAQLEEKDIEIHKRVEHNLVFFSRKAYSHKVVYIICSVLGVILPAASAICNFLPGTVFTFQTFAACACSILATLATALLSVMHSKGHWKSYRTGCEKAKSEVSNYLLGISPYNIDRVEEKRQVFLKRFEMIEKEVGGEWDDIIKEKD